MCSYKYCVILITIYIYIMEVNASPIMLYYRDNNSNSNMSNNYHHQFNKNLKTMDKSYSRSFNHIFNEIVQNMNTNFKTSANKETVGFNMALQQSNDRGCRTNMNMGSYFDICGECSGGGNTNKVDKCGVCEGDNRCISCDPAQPESRVDVCGICGLPFEDSWNNCSKIVEVLPKVVDAAVSEKGVIQVFLTKNLMSKMDILCQIISFDKNDLNIEDTTLDESVLTITFNLPDILGEYKVACSGNDNMTYWGERNITLVDSRALVLTSLQPLQVVVGEPFQMTVQVHKVITLLDLICFLTFNGSVVAFMPTNEIEGNPLMSTVRCPRFQPIYPGMYYIGVAYTHSAISNISNKLTQRLIVQPTVPKIITAMFSSDLRSVCIEFDRNIVTSSDCKRIFIQRTLTLFGKEPSCTYNTNQLYVHLGNRARIMPGDMLEFSATNGVYSALSNNVATQVIGSIRLAQIQRSRPAYQLVGPNFICPYQEPYYYRPSKENKLTIIRNSSTPLVSSTIFILTQGLQDLKYNWSVKFDTISKNQSLAPSQHQRRNVLIWFSAREMVKHFNTASITGDIKVNANMVVPNIKYKLQVVGQNYLGMEGLQVNKTVQLASLQHSPMEITVYAPIGVASMEEIMIEAKLTIVCSNKSVIIRNTKFIWEVKNENTPINVTLNNGPRLVLPPASLISGRLYDITCKLVSINNSSVLAVGETSVIPQSPRFEVYIYPSELVSGTGHTMELYSVLSTHQLDMNELQFMWTCQTDDGYFCFVPGPNPIQLEHSDAYAFRKPFLKLEPGSLPVGRYTFHVAVKIPGEEFPTHSEPSVLIMTVKNPPRISVVPPATSLLDQNKEYTISAVINDVGPQCILKWSSLSQTTFEYLPLEILIGDKSQTVLPLNFTSSVKHFPLAFSPNSLIKNGAKYKFRLEAQCGAQASHVDVMIKVPSVPVIQNFQVQPLDGIALETKFEFSTRVASARMEDFPLTYSFGYVLPSSSQYFFYTSQIWMSTEVVLPAGGAEVTGQITPLLKVCTLHKACSTTAGPNIKTKLPNNVSGELIGELSDELIMKFNPGTISEVQGLALSILTTLKLLKDQSAFLNISDLVTSLTLNQISQTMSSLDNDKTSLPTAITVLEAVTTLLPALPMSDTVLLELVLLRDKILTLIKQNSNRPARAEFLPAEPRYSKRFKRQQPVPNNQQFLSLDTIKNLLKTSETAILNFNNREKSLSEKQKLLDNMDDYISELCKIQRNSRDIYLGFKVLSLSVQRLSVSEIIKTPLPIPKCSTNCTLPPSILTLGRAFGTQYKMVDSICLAGVGFTTDILSESHNISTNQSSFRISGIYRMNVLVYSSAQTLTRFKPPSVTLQIPVENNHLSKTSYKLKCKVWDDKWTDKGCDTLHQSEGITCKCPAYSYYSVFAEQVSSETITTSTSITHPVTSPRSQDTDFLTTPVFYSPSRPTSPHVANHNVPSPLPSAYNSSAKPFILDNNSQTGLPAVTVKSEYSPLPSKFDNTSFQFRNSNQPSSTTSHMPLSDEVATSKKTLTSPTKSQPIREIPLTSKKVAFRIDENFETVMSHGVVKFEKLLKTQILEQTNISAQMIEDLYITAGSIMVTLELHDTEELTVEEAITQLAKVLNRGNMKLVGPDEKELKVPAQGLQVLEYQYLTAKSKVTTASLMPAVLLGSIVFVSCIIVLGLITKQRRDLESSLRISQRLEESAMPRYLRPHYEQTLDGAPSTLPKFPSSSNIAPIIMANSGDELDSGIVLVTDKDEQKKKTTFISEKIPMTTDISEQSPLPEAPTTTVYVT